MVALVPCCATAPVPQPDPVKPVEPAVVAPPSTPVQTYQEPPPIIIHTADLHGQFESRQGTTITIRALLMMTKTQPVVGNKGVLYCAPVGSQGESDWVPLGDVEIKKPLDASGHIQIKIVDDDKKFVIPGGKRPSPLVKNTRVKLRWEW